MRAGGKKSPQEIALEKNLKTIFSKLLQCGCSRGDAFLPSGSHGAGLKQWWHGGASPWGHEGRAPMRGPFGTGEVGQLWGRAAQSQPVLTPPPLQDLLQGPHQPILIRTPADAYPSLDVSSGCQHLV